MEQFWSHVSPAGTDECWPWQGWLDRDGYGQVRLRDQHRLIRAHRVSYELHVGPIPDGLVIDHLCRNRACVNPAHLEVVTPRENIRRGKAGQQAGAAARAKTHCVNGHEFTPENTYLRAGKWRCCMECARRRRNKHYRRSRTA